MGSMTTRDPTLMAKTKLKHGHETIIIYSDSGSVDQMGPESCVPLCILETWGETSRQCLAHWRV